MNTNVPDWDPDEDEPEREEPVERLVSEVELEEIVGRGAGDPDWNGYPGEPE